MRLEPFDVVIQGITEANKHEKLHRAAQVLARQLHIKLDIIEPLEKAKTHKYLKREGVPGNFTYTYPTGENERRANTASQLVDVMKGIVPLDIRKEFNDAVKNGAPKSIQEICETHLAKVAETFKKRDIRCKWLQRRKVIGVDAAHLSQKWHGQRSDDDIIRHTMFLPFVLPVIEKYGHISQARKDSKGRYSYELVGKAEIGGKKYAIVVILREYEPGKGLELEHRSVFGLKNTLIKSLATARGQTQGSTRVTSFQHPQASRLVVGKAALPAGRLPLIISDFSAKSIDSPKKLVHRELVFPRAPDFPDIELCVRNITPQNRKMKFAKAIRIIGRELNIPVSVEKRGHEPYFYSVQQELSDQWQGYYRDILKAIYETVTAALDLPEIQIETMRKAFWRIGKLKHKGKVPYSPETGEPLKKKAFEGLIKTIEKFLRWNTKDIAERMTTDAVAIGKVLRRKAEYTSGAAMHNITLDNLEYRNRSFDWIREDIRNLEGVLGKPLSKIEMARYQVAQDNVANLVTKVGDQVKNEIKDIILKGIAERRSRSQVAQDLFNRLGNLNRDWKRIVDTEMVNTMNLAGILQDVHDAREGEKVYFKRYALAGCCKECEKWNGTIALYSDTPLEDDNIKDEHAKVAIWDGKPQGKGKEARVLVIGAAHPYCRCGWIRWGGTRADAMLAEVQGKAAKWDDAVEQAEQEYKGKGYKNPCDTTPGYTDRINEIFSGADDVMEKAGLDKTGLVLTATQARTKKGKVYQTHKWKKPGGKHTAGKKKNAVKIKNSAPKPPKSKPAKKQKLQIDKQAVQSTGKQRAPTSQPEQNVRGGIPQNTEAQDGIRRLFVNSSSDVYEKFGAKHYTEMHRIAEKNAPDLTLDVWEKMEQYLEIDTSTLDEDKDPFYCCVGVSINIEKVSHKKLFYNEYQIAFHECAHNIDYTAARKYENEILSAFSFNYKKNLFGRTIIKEVDKLIKTIAKKTGSADKTAAETALMKEIYTLDPHEYLGIADIIGGALGKCFGTAGHSPSYWSKNKKELPEEAFANIFEREMANPEALAVIKKYLPKSYKIYKCLLKEIKKRVEK
jgi:hypothetical protein